MAEIHEEVFKIGKEVGALNLLQVNVRLNELETAYAKGALTFLDNIEFNFLCMKVLYLNKNTQPK